MRTLTALLALALVGCVSGAPREPSFVPVPDTATAPAGPKPVRPDVGVGVERLPPSPPPRPVVVIPDPSPIVVERAPRGNGTGTSGVASWYCGHGSRCTVGHSGGLFAAIRRDLLGHRGDQAKVCYGKRCVTVRIIDCNCGPHANLIDLYSDAFVRLAPLSRGLVKVTVTW